jgi:DNA-binding transcriptional MerR regulator/predicted transcriptional regulator YdeE
MNELIKIRDLSQKYDISTRTLRYYEDMGLINSTRSDNYAYRTYDEDAVKRLEQILILRKLNISIKDIQNIFTAADSEVVLKILGKKVDDIDGEVALLHELKDIILDFIRQINQADFSKDSDVKLLYAKAKEIETQLVNVDYNGNPANVNRLLEVTEKLNSSKIPEVRIVQLPKCRMATSGAPDSTYSKVWEFSNWWSEYDKKRKAVYYESLDFLYDNGGFVWLMMVENDATSEDCGGYEIIDFEGGMYAVHNSIDGDNESMGLVCKKVEKWLETSGFEVRRDAHYMGHMFSVTDEIKQGLGFHQMQVFIPVKLRETEGQNDK